MLCQNLKAIGEELSEISVLIGKCTYIFIYIDIRIQTGYSFLHINVFTT
jgi:hypothetical protein